MTKPSFMSPTSWLPQRHPLLARWVIPALMLVYLSVFWTALILQGEGSERFLIGALVTCAFVPAAIRGLWHDDWGANIYALFMAGLCYLAMPYTPASVVFLFYSQILLTQRGRWRTSLVLQLLMTSGAAWLGIHFGYNELIILIAVLLLVVSSVLDHLFFQFVQQQVDLLRSQDEVEQLARVAERERIARDLHDLLGHTLSSVRVKAELAGRLIDAQPAHAAAEIADIEQLARQSLQQVRATVSGYHDGTFASEVNSARNLLSSAGVSLNVRLNTDLSDMAERVLAAVLREAATNIVRHAEASTVELALDHLGEGYRLVLADDGRGLSGPEGHGMRGIRVRVANRKGRVDWASNHPGTVMTVWLPGAEGKNG